MDLLSVIDIGSNTIHLLVGEVKGGTVRPVRSELIAARLGEGLDRTGRIDEHRFAIAIETTALMTRIAASEGSPAPAIVATSAVRDALNGAALIDAVRDRTGLPTRILSGHEEGRLGFRGAFAAGGIPTPERALVIDLGGGSAQLSIGTPGRDPEEIISLPIGTGRIMGRFLPHDPPSQEELQILRRELAGMLPKLPTAAGASVVAIGGSARALRSFSNETLTVARLQTMASEFSRQRSSTLAQQWGLNPARARALPAAAVILWAVLDHAGFPSLDVSPTGLREGVLLEARRTEDGGRRTGDGGRGMEDGGRGTEGGGRGTEDRVYLDPRRRVSRPQRPV